jgi:hypothetical protein
MQKVKILVLAILVSGYSWKVVASNPSTGESENVSLSVSGQRATVVVKNGKLLDNALATIKVIDKSERVIYEETASINEMRSKSYDFSHLQAGKYALVLTKGAEETKKLLRVTKNGTVREDKSEAYRSFRPAITQLNKKQSLFHVALNNPIDEPLTVAVRNRQGKTVYSEEIPGKQAYAKVINLSKLKRGNYSIDVYNKHYYFYKNVTN